MEHTGEPDHLRAVQLRLIMGSDSNRVPRRNLRRQPCRDNALNAITSGPSRPTKNTTISRSRAEKDDGLLDGYTSPVSLLLSGSSPYAISISRRSTR